MCWRIGDCIADDLSDFHAAGLVQEEHFAGRVLRFGRSGVSRVIDVVSARCHKAMLGWRFCVQWWIASVEPEGNFMLVVSVISEVARAHFEILEPLPSRPSRK